MADRVAPPSAEQLGWLSVAPPTDEHDQPIAWTLSDCRIEEVKWTTPINAITHEQLTLERVELTAVQWQGVVFRNCVLREVAFTRSSFAGARFESVTFERCSFERSTFENCGFDHCRLLDCRMNYQIAIRTALRFCEIERLALVVLDMREGDLSGTTFTDCNLQGPRISKSRADTLTIAGGELRGADWTACELRSLVIDAVTIEGLRILDSELGDATLSGARVEGLAISGSKLARLGFVRCPELPGVRVLDCRITELSLDACPAVASPLIADCEIGSLAIRGSVLYDAAFERLDVDDGRIEGGELIGVLFRACTWQHLHLTDVALTDYLASEGTHIDDPIFARLELDPDLDLRTDGGSFDDL